MASGEGIPMVGFSRLSEAMFRTACELAEESEAAVGVDRMRRAIACVIMNQACLEAFLNESVELLRHSDATKPVNERKWDAVVEALEGASVELRWRVYPQLLWGKTFDRSREPFQSFHLLISLRNVLAHYDPEMGDFGSPPSRGIDSLGSKFELTDWPNGSWTMRVLNAACARWACETSKAMIQEYCRIAGDRDLWAPTPGLNALTGDPLTVLPSWREPPGKGDGAS